MEFTVPQFTEYEARVIGPLTFKQFIFVGTAGIICFVLFYKTPSYISIPLSIIILGGAGTLSLLKIGGRSPATVLKNFFFYLLSPKVYIWKRKIRPVRIIKKKEKKEIIEKEKKKAKQSRIANLATEVITKKMEENE